MEASLTLTLAGRDSLGQAYTVPTALLGTLEHLHKLTKAKNTKDTYRYQLQAFSEWCGRVCGYTVARGVEVPVELVLAHLAALREAHAKLATVRARVAFLAKWHTTQGLPSPTKDERVLGLVSAYERDIAETYKAKGKAKARPTKNLLPEPSSAILREELHRLVGAIDTSTLAGKRDKALFLLLWHGCFRVSELVELELGSVKEEELGYSITALATKTGKDTTKELWYNTERPELCPVLALREWLEASGVSEGAVFREVRGKSRDKVQAGSLSRSTVNNLVKHYVEKAELRKGKWTPHSFRAGYATQAIVDGKEPEAYIRKRGGWSTSSPCFLGYANRAHAWSVKGTQA